MRLVHMHSDTYEVQFQGGKVGRVWHFKGRWHGETNAGTAVRAIDALGASKEDVGREVERLHRAGH